MVVLRVVLEDLLLLLVVKGLQQVVDTAAELFPPLLAVDEPVVSASAWILAVSSIQDIHLLGVLDVELSGAQETEHGQGVEALVETSLLEGGAELVNLGILLRCRVAGVSALVGVGDGGEVVVVVLGVLVDLSHGEVCVAAGASAKRR